ncbi:Epimerase domain-containing protein [Fusarium sp. LHS14.1]|nr:Epimerase domain-containing protein [Fusarium sp. LHS14.1]
MKVLVVGGTGMIGGTTALYLQSLGHEVTITGRKSSPPANVPALAELPYLQGDYLELEQGFSRETLGAFEAIIFSAGTDGRHIPPKQQAEADKYYLYSDGEIFPAFARLARDAGVRMFVNIGSYTHHVAPEQAEKAAYVRSRKQAADGSIALASPSFYACSLDAPVVVRNVPGMRVPILEALVNYAQGKLGIPPFAPRWGSNIMSTTALAAAVAGALGNAAAVSRRAILLGDENWTMAEYWGMFFKAAWNGIKIEASNKDHPLLPRSSMFAGQETVTVVYKPDAADVVLLGEDRRGDVESTIRDIVREYTTS